MRHYFIIAANTYSEARHNKVLHIAGGFAAALILFSLFMGEVSLYQNEKVVKDVGLACISIFGVFVAIYLGVNTLFKELERRTIYSVVSKPVDRHEVLLGKYLGMIMVLISVVFMMTVYLYLVTAFIESKVDWALLPAIGLIIVELAVVAAMAVFFASFSTPFLSGFFCLGLFLIGRITHDLGAFGERSKNPLFKIFATWIQKIYDLEAFDLRTHVVHKLPVYAEDFWLPAAYGLFLIGILLTLSILTFRRRDFK
ncbi:MAG: ABC transporter permease subunit [Deltaproteobacteria bacterium]|nr:ABC transporter permease subunit [Deltaproteobacteria bacterium]